MDDTELDSVDPPQGEERDQAPTSLLALTPQQTEAEVVARGGRAFHARSIRKHVFERGLVDYGAMTDLSARLRESLAADLPILTGTEADRHTARDGAIKLLTRLTPRRGISGSVETVYIPSLRSGRGATLCVSTQVGCPVRCPFCASGKWGLERNLEGHEILEQYVRGAQTGPLSRSVVMGIGEPLLNLSAVRFALGVVHDEMGIGARKLTVSTVGFPDRVRSLAQERPRFQLAISLHTPYDDQRDELVPLMAGVPIEEVLEAGDEWFRATGREVTYEYVLLGEETDTPDHAAHLAERLSGRRATVNLIPYNPVPGDRWRRPSGATVDAFRADLEERGLVATVRWSRGLEADAACGQLRQEHLPG
ncbi:23S rRNA (adenine(2503)-C(2))-methyltransferase RlmN [Engelhardtia mirabilis]|uniref:Putative dual-specificity RNA methyltransferase RlmN n=1 Tax=Engelhardtia mirabilis TaxID=2528011 RepID=A0A518BJE9_9BACT|nr:putative dual-specificity RNA methyltransferase RlmN [Planctomycetes bacterium Pla133]QDV01431.1 putative dual-specificity RNA methyltransferase RlmN [Planctomycetes bacterium Pla86]